MARRPYAGCESRGAQEGEGLALAVVILEFAERRSRAQFVAQFPSVFFRRHRSGVGLAVLPLVGLERHPQTLPNVHIGWDTTELFLPILPSRPCVFGRLFTHSL